MNKPHWLDITEYIALAISVGGMIGTIIPKEVILTATPLTIALVLNMINRQRQLVNIRQLPEHHKLVEIYDYLISANESYRFSKLEIQKKLEIFEQNQASLT